MSQAHLQLIERPKTISAEADAQYYALQAINNAELANRYRLQSLIYLHELQLANKALCKRAHQVKKLRSQVAR